MKRIGRTLAVLGAGGHGRVVADCADALGWPDICFFDDNPPAIASTSWPVVGSGSSLIESVADFDGVVVGIGQSSVRLAWHRRLAANGAQMISLVHPNASVSRRAKLGSGTVVFAGAVINIGSKIGEASIVNTGATVDHDSILADGVHISPGAHLGGGVKVGEESWIGLGASIREGIVIGARVRVGAGTVVVKSVDDDLTVVGNPARVLKSPPHA